MVVVIVVAQVELIKVTQTIRITKLKVYELDHNSYTNDSFTQQNSSLQIPNLQVTKNGSDTQVVHSGNQHNRHAPKHQRSTMVYIHMSTDSPHLRSG